MLASLGHYDGVGRIMKLRSEASSPGGSGAPTT
jgi:hypothetical protein